MMSFECDGLINKNYVQLSQNSWLHDEEDATEQGSPPPTATDTLKNSNIFSCPSQANLTVTTGTSNTPTIGTTAPPSRRGRFSMDGQNPIQQALLVTPTNSHYSNTVKPPTEAVDMNTNKRPCRPNNPYASTTTWSETLHQLEQFVFVSWISDLL